MHETPCPWRSVHDVKVRRVEAQSGSRKSIGDQVHLQTGCSEVRILAANDKCVPLNTETFSARAPTAAALVPSLSFRTAFSPSA